MVNRWVINEVNMLEHAFQCMCVLTSSLKALFKIIFNYMSAVLLMIMCKLMDIKIDTLTSLIFSVNCLRSYTVICIY